MFKFGFKFLMYFSPGGIKYRRYKTEKGRSRLGGEERKSSAQNSSRKNQGIAERGGEGYITEI